MLVFNFPGYDSTMKATDKVSKPRDIRHRLGLNQQEFWGRIGVTQSGGSRYESGRTMPKPVQELLRLVHVDQIDVRKITRGDFQVISYLKAAEPGLYKRLRQQATAGNGSQRHARRRS
jgi:transcriptional regulator with XRE-family HTH domain